jgi:hypothetical protein
MEDVPSNTQQSWGALISIIIIVLMVIGGALYAWDSRPRQPQESQSTTPVEGTEIPQ